MEALSLISKMEYYAELNYRTYIRMELRLLKVIIIYRKTLKLKLFLMCNLKNATCMHKNRLLGLLYYIKFNTFASDYYGI